MQEQDKDLLALKALAEKATPGPWTVHIDGTCSGSWPFINTEALDEYGDPYTVAELPTSHVETDEARNSDDMPGNYTEKPERFAAVDGSPSLADAAYIAAANPAAILSLISRVERAEQRVKELESGAL